MRALILRVLSPYSILSILAVLPILFPDSGAAWSMATYGSMGVLISEAFKWWANVVIRWFDAVGYDWNSHRGFLPAIILPLPWAVIPTYFSFRIFDHGLQFAALFLEFSFRALWSAILACLLGALFSGLAAMFVANISRGQHPFLENAPPSPWAGFRILLALFGFPLLLWWLVRVFVT